MRLKFGTIAWTAGLLFLIYIVTTLKLHLPFNERAKTINMTIQSHHAEVININDKYRANAIVNSPKSSISEGSEVQHVAFLKVHKTASSTAQNVFLRFGDSRKLTFILPHTKGESGWPNVISYTHSITKDNIVPVPTGSHFELLCCHVIYNRKQFEEVLPLDTVYIGIVREPISRFQSAVKYFSPGFILKLPGDHPVSEYAKDPLKYESGNPVASQLNNRMAVEFGFPLELFPGMSLNGSKSEIDSYLTKLDKEFKFIIISELFDESMVYMRRLLKWTTKDILYVDKNVASKSSNPRKKLQDGDADKLRNFLYLDLALYDFAVKRFQEKTAAEGEDFNKEVEHFKVLRQKVNNYCITGKRGTLSIESSAWNHDFDITSTDCALFFKHEKAFLLKQRIRMYGTDNN